MKLSRYIYEQYNHNVSINVTKVLCDDKTSVAICDFQFVGSSVKTVLELFVNDLRNSSGGIDFSTYRLQLCLNCSVLNLTVTSEEKDRTIDKNQNNSDATRMLVTILLIIVIVFFIILILLCLGIFYVLNNCMHITNNSKYQLAIDYLPNKIVYF